MFAQCPLNNQSHDGVNGESILAIEGNIGGATKPRVAWILQAWLAPSPSGASIWHRSSWAIHRWRVGHLGWGKIGQHRRGVWGILLHRGWGKRPENNRVAFHSPHYESTSSASLSHLRNVGPSSPPLPLD